MEYIRAFICGGLLCAIAQVLIDKTKLTPAKILVSYVVAGVVFGGIGLYDGIREWGGAGATIPLTGFGANIAKGIRDAVGRDGFLGIFTGGFTAAAGGVTAAILFGYLTALCFSSRDKS